MTDLKKITLLTISLLLFSSFVFASPSINFLSKGQADTLYCLIDGSNCLLGAGGNGTYALNVSGDTGLGVILDNEIFSILGINGLSTSMAGNILTITKTNQTSLDTNETPRFNNLLGNCTGTDKMYGTNEDGVKHCEADVDTDTTLSGADVVNHVGNWTNDKPDYFLTASHTLGLHEGLGLWSTSNFTTTNITNWDTAYSWGDHSIAGYLTTGDSLGNHSAEEDINMNDNGIVNVTELHSDTTINLRTSDDDDDYLEFAMESGTPAIRRIGGGAIYFKSDDANTVYFVVREDTSHRLNIAWEKNNNRAVLDSTTYIYIPDKIELEDDLNITDGNISMNDKYICHNINCSSYTYHNGTHLIIQT